MVSPAQRHRMMVLGRAAAAVVAETVALAGAVRGEPASEYELLRAALGIDLKRLKTYESTEHKVAAKRDMLPKYEAWIDGVLAAEADGKGGAPDDIVTHMMIWRIDTGDYAGALPLVAYVLKHKIPLPERFKRSAATLVAEQMAEAALQALAQGEPFDVGYLLEVEDLTDGGDMIDQVRAKLMKAIGLLLARAGENADPAADGPAGAKRAGIEAGLAKLRRALALDQGAGVKGDIKRLESAAKKLSEPPAPPTATAQPPGPPGPPAATE